MCTLMLHIIGQETRRIGAFDLFAEISHFKEDIHRLVQCSIQSVTGNFLFVFLFSVCLSS